MGHSYKEWNIRSICLARSRSSLSRKPFVSNIGGYYTVFSKGQIFDITPLLWIIVFVDTFIVVNPKRWKKMRNLWIGMFSKLTFPNNSFSLIQSVAHIGTLKVVVIWESKVWIQHPMMQQTRKYWIMFNFPQYV